MRKDEHTTGGIPARHRRVEGRPSTTGDKRRETRLLGSEEFAQATIDALGVHICVLDEKGVILSVNRAWRDFARANQPEHRNVAEGVNYLAVCDSSTGPGAEQAAG